MLYPHIALFLQKQSIALALLVPIAITFFLLPCLIDLSPKMGLVDKPGRRKIHRTAKPLVGGIVIALSVGFTALLFFPLINMRGFYTGMLLLVLTGILDDFNELNHRRKFTVQVVAALAVSCLSDVSLHTFGDLLSLGQIDFAMLSIPMTIVGTVGVCNAINMIDGLDGLAGGICLTVFCTFAYLSYLDNHTSLMLLSLCISGCLIAFLRYNWHPAKIFMGDAGSLFLGFAAAFISIAITQEPESIVRPVTPLLVLAVPIVDTVTVMLRRLMKGKSPFLADKGHLHHILLRMGFSKRKTVAIIILLSAFFCAAAIAGTLLQVPEHYLFTFFMAYFAVYFISSFRVRYFVKNRAKLSLRYINPLF